MDTAFSYLAGNALGWDKKGRPTKDSESGVSQDAMAAVGQPDGGEYSAFVYYELEIE